MHQYLTRISAWNSRETKLHFVERRGLEIRKNQAGYRLIVLSKGSGSGSESDHNAARDCPTKNTYFF